MDVLPAFSCLSSTRDADERRECAAIVRGFLRLFPAGGVAAKYAHVLRQGMGHEEEAVRATCAAVMIALVKDDATAAAQLPE